jgi:hypothetical protein
MSVVSQKPDRNRKVRAGLVLLLVLAGTALIGWGGLAAWTAVTQNNGSSFGTGGVHHSNVATILYPSSQAPVTCYDTSSSTTNPPQGCGLIFDVSNAEPGFNQNVGKVTITNIGTLNSTFVLQLTSQSKIDTSQFSVAPTPAPPNGTTLCGSLVLTITDAEATPVTVYSGALASYPAAGLAINSVGHGATWDPGDSDTFTFNLQLPSTSANTDMSSICTANATWTQTLA